MSVCVVVDSGYLKPTSETDCSEFLLLTQSEYNDIQAGSVTEIISTLNYLFEFDLGAFGVVHGSLMLAFLVGHGAGRVVKLMNKR